MTRKTPREIIEGILTLGSVGLICYALLHAFYFGIEFVEGLIRVDIPTPLSVGFWIAFVIGCVLYYGGYSRDENPHDIVDNEQADQATGGYTDNTPDVEKEHKKVIATMNAKIQDVTGKYPERIYGAYGQYDSDKRTNGINDFEAYADSIKNHYPLKRKKTDTERFVANSRKIAKAGMINIKAVVKKKNQKRNTKKLVK